MEFKLKSEYKPTGDQPQAIQSLLAGLSDGLREQTLLGITGSGKTFTMANIIAQSNRPALVIAHNKTLAAQLCNEFREFFPQNRVEFFVSYYDYYQPEAYIAKTDTYIEKEMDINEEIDKLRHSATCSLFERRDTIVVASVSCIYGLGDPATYSTASISLRPGDNLERNALMRRLVEMRYERNDIDFKRSTFRAKGDVVDIFPAYATETAYRVEYYGDEIESISEINALTGKKLTNLSHMLLFPATHFAASGETVKTAIAQIKADAEAREQELKEAGRLIEAQRIRERTAYDVEMMQEMGYCSGIENYSRYFDGRQPGEPPYVLLDYFPKDFLVFIDESHITLPQIRGMYNGDRARKRELIDYGFRLPAAYDNRPLRFEEFNDKTGQLIYVSATPSPYELERSGNIAEQIIRPTGLLDPEIEVRPITGQIDDLICEINKAVEAGGRVLVTTLTKKMAESLTTYLGEHGIRVKYLHSEIVTLERVEIINGLRAGDFDVIVGINLLREGLDLPEVRLVAILDADKEGFLRSESSLIQTIGRAARNSEAKVIMYADRITDSMRRAMDVTERRRKLQHEYNLQHGIIPKTIVKNIKNTLEVTTKLEKAEIKGMSKKQIIEQIEKLKALMSIASKSLDFEQAIELRDEIAQLRKQLG
ncbi:MAG: excinuclease ABC subunit UvrB [Firmicutes bacterium]|nr:excinuclease ABC subunit UvrB [Bacillota bacterium]